jgi:hypothetical protein
MAKWVSRKVLGGGLIIAVVLDFVLPRIGIHSDDIPFIIYFIVGLYLFSVV